MAALMCKVELTTLEALIVQAAVAEVRIREMSKGDDEIYPLIGAIEKISEKMANGYVKETNTTSQPTG